MEALHGRDRELDVVSECLAATAGGHGGVLLIDGPPGIGKSRLLDEARAMARRAGLRALSGGAHEGSRAVPFAPLFEAVIADDHALVDAATARAGIASDRAFWFTNELPDALQRAANDQPLVVILDDLQWADTPTIQVVSALSRELADTPVSWVLAMRSGEAGPSLRQAVGRLDARRLSVAALSVPGVEAAVRGLLGGEPDATLLTLTARAQGNPFVLIELLHGLREEGRLRVEDGRVTVTGTQVPRRLTRSMRDRLTRLPEDARRLVQVAAVANHDCTAEQISALLRLGRIQLAEALDAAVRADLLVEAGEHLAFRHDLLREAVFDTLPRSLRRALQREAVAVRLERGAQPVEVAQQLAICAEPGDRIAIATLRAAARDLGATDSGAAADLLDRALELLARDDPERGALVAEAVIALHRALRSEEALALAELELGGALEPEEEAVVRLSVARLMQLRHDARSRESEIALALPGVSAPIRARHHAWLAYSLAMDGHVDRARELLGAADRTGDLEARIVAATASATLEALGGACVGALGRIEAIGDLIRETAWVPDPSLSVVEFSRSAMLGQLGRLDEAQTVMLDGLAVGRRRRDPRLLRVWAQIEGLLHAACGRLAEARAAFDGPADAGPDVAPATYVGVARMLTLAQVAVHTGDAGLLRVAVVAARQVADDSSSILRAVARWTLALAAAARGDMVAAAGVLADEPVLFAMPLVPNSAASQPAIVRIALAGGDRALAERAAAAAETFARLNPGVSLLAAVAAHASGLVDADHELVSEATTVLRRGQRPLLHAAAAEDAGLLLARAGRPIAAIERLDEAFEAFHAVDATTDMRRVGHQLRELGARRRPPARRTAGTGWDALTDAELSVVGLVAGGATNREAAEHLYVSPHTVASHIRNAFRKLEIRSRVELAAIVAQRG